MSGKKKPPSGQYLAGGGVNFFKLVSRDSGRLREGFWSAKKRAQERTFHPTALNTQKPNLRPPNLQGKNALRKNRARQTA
jgi:hypothetical protein